VLWRCRKIGNPSGL